MLYREPGFRYHEIPFIRNVDLQGNFQSPRYIEGARTLIRDLFSEPAKLTPEIDAFLDRQRLSSFSAVHMRFYLHPERDIGHGPMEALPAEYYRRVFNELRPDIPTVVSTDNKPNAIELLKLLEVEKRTILLEFEDPLADFYTLTRAEEIAISNSSFSWWASQLGKPKSRIFAPDRHHWFDRNVRGTEFWDPADLYPQDFIELPAT